MDDKNYILVANLCNTRKNYLKWNLKNYWSKYDFFYLFIFYNNMKINNY